MLYVKRNVDCMRAIELCASSIDGDRQVKSKLSKMSCHGIFRVSILFGRKKGVIFVRPFYCHRSIFHSDPKIIDGSKDFL